MGKLLNSGYGAIFGSYWMIYAIISSFASVFLLDKGYSNSQIGITLAVANILAVVLQPLVADFADRSRKLGIIEVTELFTIALLLLTVGLFIFDGGTLALCGVFVALLAIHTVLQPLFNSLAFRLESSGYKINFGIARSFGSLAYSIFVAILGSLVERHGTIVMPVLGEVMCLMLLISLIFTGICFSSSIKNNHGPVDSSVNDEEYEEIRLSQFIKRNKLFFVINIGVVGLFFSNAVLNNYMAQIVDAVNGTTEDLGKILALMAFLEIPTMVFFSNLRKRFSCQFLLKVASIGFTVKVAVCWLAPNVMMLYVGQFFQVVSFALFLPGMVAFTGEIMSKGEAVKGQALYTTMITVTTIFSSLLGGWILDIAGAKMLTFISTVITAAGAAVIIAVIDKVKGAGPKENNMMEYVCPVCRKHVFERKGDYEICPVCGWENDPVQADDPDFAGGANSESLNEAIDNYEEYE